MASNQQLRQYQKQALEKNLDHLVSCMAHEINILMDKARGEGLIGEQAHSQSEGLSKDDRARKLLNIISNRMAKDDSTFPTLLKMFRSDASLEYLANSLETTYNELAECDRPPPTKKTRLESVALPEPEQELDQLVPMAQTPQCDTNGASFSQASSLQSGSSSVDRYNQTWIDEIETLFNGFYCSVWESLKKSKAKELSKKIVKNLKLSSFEELTIQRKGASSTFASFSDCLSHIEGNDSSVEEVLRKLKPFNSFFDFPILERIVAKGKSPKNKQLLVDYKNRFDQVCQLRLLEFPETCEDLLKELEKVYNFKAVAVFERKFDAFKKDSNKEMHGIEVTEFDLDPKFHVNYTNIEDDGTAFSRGSYPYHPPYGWKCFALKVRGKYDDDVWLGQPGYRTESSPGEWPVTYFGCGKKLARQIITEGYKSLNRKQYFTSPSVTQAEEYSRKFPYTAHGKKACLFVIQNRVNPNIEGIEKSNLWTSFDPKHIRPCAICTKNL